MTRTIYWLENYSETASRWEKQIGTSDKSWAEKAQQIYEYELGSVTRIVREKERTLKHATKRTGKRV